MTRKLTWARVTAGIALAYGVFLIIQAFFPQLWPNEETHCGVQMVGGIILILWVAYFWKLR